MQYTCVQILLQNYSYCRAIKKISAPHQIFQNAICQHPVVCLFWNEEGNDRGDNKMHVCNVCTHCHSREPFE